MARTIVFRGEISRLALLDEDGRLSPEAGEIAVAQVVGLYEAMVRTRLFDERAFLLQREGRIGTYAPSLGQEAAQIGSAAGLEEGDWVVPSYRENGVLLARGVPMENILLYWGGDSRGMELPKRLRILPYCIPVGTQVPHAVGLALAMRYRGERAVVACYFGDGATSTGDFHEGLTFAGVTRAPVVFFCQNNQWAISVPRQRQCAAETLAQKALGYGIDGLQVDGNDVLACLFAMRDAAARARSGKGPTLIEAVTYRLGDHTTADDASRYRDPAEVEWWRRRDPLLRVRRFLERAGAWDDAREAALHDRCHREIDDAIRRAESLPPLDPADLGRFTYPEPAGGSVLAETTGRAGIA
jgi:pyruvate dehydrogenase E1 component alpha subunit